ncbi:UTP--glucose-1-phosphate uridylyltransferase [Salipaludibacillus neizhouensis]|uniref:UTP--glucose-1-phosphate uridylyltransferase n=1 Tax=Salipaludibacillus neizhouensis TaxID=885475 RepID=A0A3A9KB32_9BACI|nr:UTP--glucose-1-phosphate uridylyltransferase [Salipaludibacillus neizhouensis]RKL69359.1 UTP--glucose-1-phosphate uridylyltransferase [Salipaludibacillus neizhouensis]
MRTVKKAIIPAAGYGTRNLPITKVIPKEMFPVAGKPAIQLIVEEAIEAGIEEILIVVSRNKSVIIDYFDRSLEYEYFLVRTNKHHLLDKIKQLNVYIQYVRQPFPEGLGAAINLGKQFSGSEPFAVLLPDDIYISSNKPALTELLDVYHTYQTNLIALENVKQDQLKNYGVVKANSIQNNTYEILDIVEKPQSSPPSNLAVSGRYIFEPTIFSYLEKTAQGTGGEVQLTDAIKQLLTSEKCFGVEVVSERFDIGSEQDYFNLIQKIMGQKMTEE